MTSPGTAGAAAARLLARACVLSIVLSNIVPGIGGARVGVAQAASAAPTGGVALRTDRASVPFGEATTLRWSAPGGSTCVADGGWTGARSPAGSMPTPRLQATTRFGLACTVKGVVVRGAVTVAVDAPDATLAASATAVSDGESVRLNWTARSVSSCAASGGWSGSRARSGAETIAAVRAPTTFTLTCTGSAARRITRSVRVQVRPAASLSLSSSRVRNGATVSIRWRATAGSTCDATSPDANFRGRVPTEGTRTSAAITTTRTYAIRCTNALGSALSSASVSPGLRIVRWNAPSRATDGSAIGQIQGYRIHAGRTADDMTPIARLTGRPTSAELSLASGDWYVSVSVLALVRTERGVMAVRESDLTRPFLRVSIP